MYSRHEYILVVYHAPNIFLSILQDSIIIVLTPPPPALSVKTPRPDNTRRGQAACLLLFTNNFMKILVLFQHKHWKILYFSCCHRQHFKIHQKYSCVSTPRLQNTQSENIQNSLWKSILKAKKCQIFEKLWIVSEYDKEWNKY